MVTSWHTHPAFVPSISLINTGHWSYGWSPGLFNREKMWWLCPPLCTELHHFTRCRGLFHNQFIMDPKENPMSYAVKVGLLTVLHWMEHSKHFQPAFMARFNFYSNCCCVFPLMLGLKRHSCYMNTESYSLSLHCMLGCYNSSNRKWTTLLYLLTFQPWLLFKKYFSWIVADVAYS